MIMKRLTNHLITLGLSFLIILPAPVAAQTADDCSESKLRDLGVLVLNCSGDTPTSCGDNSNLIGSENAEKIWNYFIDKGLTPPQAAGIMGNLQAESHFEPRLVQYGGVNSRGEISKQGQPSSLDDTMVIDGKTGYGLAQWTDKGRQQRLHAAAVAVRTKDSDLSVQLNYLWLEMAGLLQEIQALDDVAAVTSLFMIKFERPKDQSQTAQNARIALSRSILNSFGSGVASATTGPLTSSCANLGNFSYGRYASLSRQELIDIILNAPNWKPQSQNPTTDIKSGVASENLLRIIAALLENLPNERITPSVIQTGHSCRVSDNSNISNHMGGLAIDLGGAGHTPASMANIFVWLSTNSAALGVNELIFNPTPDGTSTLRHGKPHKYNASTQAQHRDHIHLSVEGPKPTTCPNGT